MTRRHEQNPEDGANLRTLSTLLPSAALVVLVALAASGCSDTGFTAPPMGAAGSDPVGGEGDVSDRIGGDRSGGSDDRYGSEDSQRMAGQECESPDPAWIWCDDFEQDRLDRYFEYSDAGGSFVRRDDVGVDGSAGMRARFRAGQVTAGDLKLAFGRTPSSRFSAVDDGASDYREVYWRVYLRHQEGWEGGGGDKLSRATSLVSGDWSQSMIAHVWSSRGEDRDYLALDPASGTDSSGSLRTSGYNDFGNLRWLGAKRGSTPLFDEARVGRWYCVEAHVRLNDAGRSNGVFEFWVDGQREVRTDDLNWLGSFDEYGINAVFLENYWNAGSPRTQERYFDGFVVSTERIGC